MGQDGRYSAVPTPEFSAHAPRLRGGWRDSRGRRRQRMRRCGAAMPFVLMRTWRSRRGRDAGMPLARAGACGYGLRDGRTGRSPGDAGVCRPGAGNGADRPAGLALARGYRARLGVAGVRWQRCRVRPVRTRGRSTGPRDVGCAASRGAAVAAPAAPRRDRPGGGAGPLPVRRCHPPGQDECDDGRRKGEVGESEVARALSRAVADWRSLQARMFDQQGICHSEPTSPRAAAGAERRAEPVRPRPRSGRPRGAGEGAACRVDDQA